MPSAIGDDPRMLALTMELPGFPGRASWAYLLEDATGSMHLLDCGADSDANHRVLVEALARRGKSITDVASVTATHVHYDHVGMAARVRSESGAGIGLHEADVAVMAEGRTYGGAHFADRVTRWGVPEASVPDMLAMADRRVAQGVPVEVERALVDGDRLDIPGWDLRVLATPGHTAGHICLVDDDTRVAFVGDHVLSDSNPGVGLGGPTPGNAVEEYASSLGRLRAAEPVLLLAGHGHPIIAIPERLAALLANQQRRRDDVREAAAAAGAHATVWEIASGLRWSGGWKSLSGVRLFSALNQVQLHLESLGQR